LDGSGAEWHSNAERAVMSRLTAAFAPQITLTSYHNRKEPLKETPKRTPIISEALLELLSHMSCHYMLKPLPARVNYAPTAPDHIHQSQHIPLIPP